MINIRIASQSGFCMGVRRAVNLTLEESRRYTGDLYTHGQLIHNPQIIDLLERRGICAAKRFETIKHGKVIIRAHGVPPQAKEQLKVAGLEILDATCPHVARIHKIIQKYIGLGYNIVIIGDKGHAEVAGLEGSANGRSTVIGTLEEAQALQMSRKVCVVAQTTQSVKRFLEMTNAIKAKYPDCVVFDTICRSTEDRQKEIIELSQKADITLVVGGKISANTQRLVGVVREAGREAMAIEDEGDLSPSILKDRRNILVAAGASTPNWMIHRIVEHIRKLEYANRSILFRWGIRLAELLNGAYVHLGIVAALLSLSVWRITGGSTQTDWKYLVIIFSYIIAMYTLNHLTNIEANQLQEIFKRDPINRYRGAYKAIAALSSVAALSISYLIGIASGFFVSLLVILGLVYNMNVIPKTWRISSRYRRLKDIPLSKDIGISLAWLSIIVLLPLIPAGIQGQDVTSLILAGVIVFGTAFLRALGSDLQDVQKDMFLGRETLPTFFGRKRVWRISMLINCVMLGAILAGIFLGKHSLSAIAFLLLPVLMFAILWSHHKEKLPKMTKLGIIMDAAISFVCVLTILLKQY